MGQRRGRGAVNLGPRWVDVVVGVVFEIGALPCTVWFRQELAEMLKINRTITHLNLQYCYIGVEGIKAQRIEFVRAGSGEAFWAASKTVDVSVDVADDVWTHLSAFDVWVVSILLRGIAAPEMFF